MPAKKKASKTKYTKFAYDDAKPFTPEEREKIEEIVREEIRRLVS